jgi:hypothetical protein
MPGKTQFRNIIWCLLLILSSTGCNLVLESEITPIPTADIPQIEFLLPMNNQQVVEGIVFDIEVVAHDNNSGVALIELSVDGEQIHAVRPIEKLSEPIFTARMNWRAQGVGLHSLEAVAYRPDGTQGDPAIITVEVIVRDE